MKTLILAVTASLTIASASANAASVNNCPQILEALKANASLITQNANSYWRHRANFVNLNYYQVVPNAQTRIGQEESQGNTLRKAMPNGMAIFNDQVTTALSHNCLTPTQLSAIAEPVIKHVKRIKFDKFPENEERPMESSANQGLPPRMPNN